MITGTKLHKTRLLKQYKQHRIELFFKKIYAPENILCQILEFLGVSETENSNEVFFGIFESIFGNRLKAFLSLA